MRVLRSVRQLSQRTNLPNGASVITSPSDSGVACVGLISNCGSRAELQSSQATVNRSITLDNLAPMAGVNVSSYVQRERTGVFGLAIPSKAGSFAANLVGAANAREVSDSAREHALAALHAASGDKDIVTEDYLHMGAYQETPLGASPFGTTAGIMESDATDLINWRKCANGGRNAIIVGTGNVDHDELVAAASELEAEDGFAPLPKPCQFTGCLFQDRNDFEEDAWVRLSFQVPGLNKPRENAVFQVLKHVFGSYTPGDQHLQHSINPLIKSYCSTRPIRRMEEGGYTRYVFNDDIKKIDGTLYSYSDTALFGYYARIPDAYGHSKGVLDRGLRADNVNYRLMREIKRYWTSLGDHEIAAAKNAAILEYHQNMSVPLTQADALGAQGLVSKSPVAAPVATMIQGVTRKSIEAAVHKYIFDQEFVEAWYGCSDAATDAGAARERSWNFLPGGQGLEMNSPNAY